MLQKETVLKQIHANLLYSFDIAMPPLPPRGAPGGGSITIPFLQTGNLPSEGRRAPRATPEGGGWTHNGMRLYCQSVFNSIRDFTISIAITIPIEKLIRINQTLIENFQPDRDFLFSIKV